MLDQLQAERAAYAPVLVEVEQARVADGVAAVDQDARQPILHVEVVLAQHAAAQVQQLAHELADLLQVLGGGVVGLLEEVLRWVLDRLHFEFLDLIITLFQILR